MAEDIAQWLDRLGLGQYAQAFADNGIDIEALPHLRDEDFERLGVLLGHMRRLQAAIEALSADEPPTRPVPPPSHEPEPQPTEAERRQLTVMFCDLVGSTALSARLDPEDMREIIRAYQNAVAGEITRFDGHVAKYMGDGVLAYFGYPKAHEDEAERAVRAGLAVVEAVTRHKAPDGESLAARVGIATGLVVVGDLTGEGAAQEQAVIGEAPNLAARLQALAKAGAVVIAPSTRQLLGELFDVSDLGKHSLKGLPEPVQAWRVIGESAVEGRFEALHFAGLTPLVGREEELELLFRRWRQAKEGEGQVVLLSGEAGIGKSRITQALRQRLADEPHTRLRYFCSPYHVNSALYPVIAQLQRAAGFQQDDPPEDKLDKLEALLSKAGTEVSSAAPLIAAVLSIPIEARYPPLDLSPRQQKAKTLEALLKQLEGLAEAQPVLVILEDAHWIDPTSSELFELIVDRIQHLPVFLVITFRPELTPPWTGHGRVTSLTLNRLSRNQGAALVERVAADKPLPGEVLDQILAKSDGVPLFVEELTKTVLESGLLEEESDRYSMRGPIPALAIPTTLQDSLMARLDYLNEAKEIAQIGAIVGREFSYDLITAIAEKPEAEVIVALDRLVQSGMVFRRGVPPNATYVFKHALMQDAAYSTLLISRRRRLHRLVLEALETRAGVDQSEKVELLAHHAFQGEIWEKAYTYLRQAGITAMARSANREAAAFLEQALTCLGHVPEGREAVERAIDTRFDLRTALQALGDQDRIHDRLREAISLAESLGDLHRQARASNLMTQYYWWTGRPDRAVVSGERTCALVEPLNDIGLKVVADAYLGAAYHALGNYKRAMELLQQPVAALSGDLIYQRFGQVMIPAVFSRVILTWCHAERGEFGDGMVHGDNAIRIAETADHSYSLTLAHLAVGMLHLRKGDLTRAISVLERGLSLCEIADVPVRFPWFAAALGIALSLSGRTAEGLPLVKQAVERASAMNVTVDQSLRYRWLSEAYMVAGQVDEALRLAERALELAREHRERGNEAWILQLLGVLCLSGDAPNLGKAETFSRQALALAAELGMEPLSAHSHLGLAMFYWKSGRRQEASCEKATAVAKFQNLDMPFWLEREQSNITEIPSDPGS